LPEPLRPPRAALGVLLLAAFCGGALVDRLGLLPGPAPYAPPGLRRTFAPFWETWNLVQEHYVDRQAVQPVRMTHGSIAGMLNSLGDVGHTTFLAPDEVTRLSNELSGQLEGIGAGLTSRDRRPAILYTIPGSPARAAGLQPGDVIQEVDGKDVSRLPLDQVVRLVRGQPGTAVRLRVLRPGTSAPLDFEITRAKVEIPLVSWRLVAGQPVAHVALRSFGEHAGERVKAAIREARGAGAKGIVLDLRGDPGGLRKEAVAVASEFLPGGVVFIEVDARGRREEVPVTPGGTGTDVPLVALVDQGTASSAEIVAGALQDHHRAKLVGTRTFGTGTVLKSFQLSDGSAVLLAIQEWLTPDGRQIWHKGITPDVEVEMPPKTSPVLPEAGPDDAPEDPGSDAQLRAALDVLRKQLP
jgi:carboxyl-terminal processing protease